MKNLTSIFRFTFLVALFSSIVSFAIGTPMLATSFVVGTGYAILSVSKCIPQGVLGVGINKEVWLADLAENFYPSGGWFNRSIDYSALVDNDRINWAVIGSDPVVYVNRDTLANPIPITARTDSHAYVELDTLDTANTPVTNVEEMETMYDKRASILTQHRNTLRTEAYKRAIFSWSPASNGSGMVISTSGATNSGHKRFVADDLANLAQAWNNLEYPQEGRVLVLNSKHLTDLQAQDIQLYKALVSLGSGQPIQLYGFDVYVGASVMPRYNKSTLARVAYGAAGAGTDSPASSIAWIESQVFRADGSYDMFLREKDPEIRADFMGFQKRFASGQTANRGVGAIVTVAAS
jgi:hypothetical protein